MLNTSAPNGMADAAQPLIQPILQFGTSRFLQAHVDLFVSQALESGDAVGGITVVQTTDSPNSAARIAALASGAGYPVRIRGLRMGQVVDETLSGLAIREAVRASTEWDRICEAARGPVEIIVSNTGDLGYQLDARDHADLLVEPMRVPRSFPAKLLVLLFQRWQCRPEAPLSLFPCELVSRNGDVLRGIVTKLASHWHVPDEFIRYLLEHCVWANSLVDRIVSEEMKPVGAVAEPYALWAIERQPRLLLPCSHPSIVLTGDLEHFERLKLFLLNLGHTYLAECWLRDGRPADETVCQAMTDALPRRELEAVWLQEVLPVFEALGKRDEALAYLDDVRDRFLNPFLNHRIADIAQNHAQKKQRRIVPLLEIGASLARSTGLRIQQARLRAAVQYF